MEEQGNQDNMEQQGNTPGQSESPQVSHKSDGKLWAILGYIFTILFFVPLVMKDLKENAYSRFHANQQLVLLLLGVVGLLLKPVLGLGVLIHIFGFVLMIMGIVNAAGGKMKKLPLVGSITLIK